MIYIRTEGAVALSQTCTAYLLNTTTANNNNNYYYYIFFIIRAGRYIDIIMTLSVV